MTWLQKRLQKRLQTVLQTTFQKTAVPLLLGIFWLSMGNAVAQDVSVQKLLEVEEQLHSEQKKNEQTKQDIAQLEKKVQCTYSMVKGYEKCEASFTEKSADYFACIEQARKDKEECMLELSADSP